MLLLGMVNRWIINHIYSVDNNGNLYTTDPEGYRVLHFTTIGNLLIILEILELTYGFNLPTGIIVDEEGGYG